MGLTLNYGAFALERCLQLKGDLEALSPRESWKHCYLKLQQELLHRDHPGPVTRAPLLPRVPAGRLKFGTGWAESPNAAGE